MSHRSTLPALLVLVLTANAHAQSETFKVGGEGMANKQTLTIESDADFENFTSQTNKIQGTVIFDPKAMTGSAKLTVDIASVDTGIPKRNEHMMSEGWFDTAKYPTAEFETTSVKHLSGDKFKVTGKFTVHGVTRTITTEATVKHLPETDKTRAVGIKGNGVMVRVAFEFKLSDYGISVPDRLKQKVADKLKARLVVFGSAG